MRPPLSALLVALLLGGLTSFAAACGEDREGLLTATRAERMQDHLDRIDELVASGRCEGVADRLRALSAEVEDLPESTDSGLRARLEEGVANLEQQAPEDCRGDRTTETQPETQTQETVPETTPTETAPAETTPPETTPPETTPPSEEVPEETPPGQGTPPGQEDDGTPGNSGGSEAPGFGVIRP